MDIKEIQNLIKFVAKSGASEVKLEMDDIKITIKTGSESDAPVVQYAPVAAQTANRGAISNRNSRSCNTSSNRRFKIYYYKITNHWNFL